MLVLLTLTAFFNTAFVEKNKVNTQNQVMVYGIVYVTECGSEAFETYEFKLVNQSDAYQEQENLRAELSRNYPNAKRIKVSTSKYDYGSSATNMCAIKWQVKGYNCSYQYAAAYFGTSESEALNKAIQQKNSWAGENASYSILIQKYW